MKTNLLVITLAMLAPSVALAQDATSSEKKPASGEDVWAPFRPLIGKWVGEREAFGEKAKQSVEFRFVLGGKFLQYRTKTIEGSDPHADLGMISYDKARKRFVARAFFSEGFVNHYIGAVSADGKTIEFVTESVENGPPGLRAKEIIRLDGAVMKQECLLASGDKPFKRCIAATMKKQR